MTRQNISSCSVLSPEIVTDDDAYIGGRSENNIKCVVHDDLGWKNRTTRYILPRHWLYKWFSQFHRCGTYSVLSRSPSIIRLSWYAENSNHWNKWHQCWWAVWNLQSSVAEVKNDGASCAEPRAQERQSRHLFTFTWSNVSTSLQRYHLSALQLLHTPAIHYQGASTLLSQIQEV